MGKARHKRHILYNSIYKKFLENDITEGNSNCLRLRGRSEDWLKGH